MIRQIEEINPDARLIFQTVYNPFETDDEKMKPVYSPLYTFTSIYLGTINSSIRNGSGMEYADIQNKFRGGCTLYTNIKNMDIHPNKIGHLLIAEEIVQQLRLSGENGIFIRELESMISTDKIPEELRSEIERLSLGQFRVNETEDVFAGPEITQEASAESQTDETKNIETQTAVKKAEKIPDKAYMTILPIVGLAAAVIILAAVLVKRKKKDKKQN